MNLIRPLADSPSVRALRQGPPARALQGLRRLAQFWRFLSQIFHPLPTGAVQSAAETAARYQELANSLCVPPDRLVPLARFERAVEGEATLVGRMAHLAAEMVIANYCAMKTTDSFACAMRDQHAKPHGCVTAEFVVRDDLPGEFATALFRAGARYPTMVRFSNGNGKPQSDKRIDGRGMAIKLHNVERPTLLRELVPEKTPAGEHDFLLSSYPVFFCKNVIDYTELMDAVTAPCGTFSEKLAFAVRWFKFVVRYPRQFFTFLRIGVIPIDDPLTFTYHSMSPFLFGEDHVVRYIVSPVILARKISWWHRLFSGPRSDNYLRDALVSDLRPTAQPGSGQVAFDFSVRVRDRATPADVEDASLWWTAPRDRVVKLASILIQRQNLEPDRQYAGERTMFSPWNCLPEHRPLGSVNRMRLAVYLASLKVRQKLNMVSS